jgi:hypothetical protein
MQTEISGTLRLSMLIRQVKNFKFRLFFQVAGLWTRATKVFERATKQLVIPESF